MSSHQLSAISKNSEAMRSKSGVHDYRLTADG